MYYVYEYFNVETGEVFHVGAGSKNRLFSYYQRSKEFYRMVALNKTSVRIYRKDLTKEEAIQVETERIAELKSIGEAQTNKALKGTIPDLSDETKVKMSINSQKKVFTEKHRKNLGRSSATLNPNIKKKVSDALKGRNYRNEEWVITLTTGSQITFDTRKDAAEYFGVSKSLIGNWAASSISVRWKKIIKRAEVRMKEL
ncbi:hypothetical protein ACIQAA_27160 [Neobacillus sp. NPDC093182]|uniref:hypothetical protein n=1 Tax=Neobacillus sp. NPDC093182 TaxID=3364297 RepID=UPI00381DE483